MTTFFDWLAGRVTKVRRSRDRMDSAAPQDRHGRPATDTSVELHVAPAGDFWIRTDRDPPALLTWHSTDTSVARLEVSPDTFSALVRVLAPGVTQITASDGLAVLRRIVTVRTRPIPGARPIAARIEPIRDFAGAGDGSPMAGVPDEAQAPAHP